MSLKERPMPKAHIRDGELRLPLTNDLRAKLDVHEGEELTAHVFEGSVTFTRTTDDARHQAGRRVAALLEQIQLRPGQPEMSEEDVDQMVDEEVKAYRRDRRNRS